MTTSRREMLQLARAGMASAAALSFVGFARAQVAEEAESPPLEIVRKGIDKHLRAWTRLHYWGASMCSPSRPQGHRW